MDQRFAVSDLEGQVSPGSLVFCSVVSAVVQVSLTEKSALVFPGMDGGNARGELPGYFQVKAHIRYSYKSV